MNAIDLMVKMGEMGTMFRETKIQEIAGYCALMLNDERVIVISEDKKPCAFIFYSITDDPEKYLKKGQYEYLPHSLEGKTVYVEKLVSFFWNRDLRVIFERIITEKHPQLEHGAWHRASKHGDRQVITKRRLHGIQHSDIKQ
jgi:hypothetical protein